MTGKKPAKEGNPAKRGNPSKGGGPSKKVSPRRQRFKVDGSSGDKTLENRMLDTLDEAFEMWKKKHFGYGPSNINKHGEPGVVVRIGDKESRMNKALFHGGQAEAKKIESDYIDTLVYCAIALLLRRGLWPKGD